jgi:hypothetical protein
MSEDNGPLTERPPESAHRCVHRAIFIAGLVVCVVLLVALFQGCTTAVHVP